MRVRYEGTEVIAGAVGVRGQEVPDKLLVDRPESPKNHAQAKDAWHIVWQEEGKAPFDSIRIGRTTYRLYETARPLVRLDDDATYKLVLPTFPGSWQGEGETSAAALESWVYRLHRRFQQLWPKLPEEMTEEEHKDWNVIQACVRVEETLADQAIVVRVTARVISTDPWRIAIHGGEEFDVAPPDAPPEFVAFEPGQWITATCHFHRATNELMMISDAVARAPIREMSSQETDNFVEGLPKTTDLPCVDWQDI